MPASVCRHLLVALTTLSVLEGSECVKVSARTMRGIRGIVAMVMYSLRIVQICSRRNDAKAPLEVTNRQWRGVALLDSYDVSILGKD